MSFYIVVNQVLILFIIMFIGVFAGKTGIIANGASKKLSELLLYITSPMLVLCSFFLEYSADKMRNALLVFLLGSAFFIFTILLSGLIFKKTDSSIKPVMRFAVVFSNCGFIGLPMMKVMYGNDGVFLGSFYIVAFNLFFWTFGMAIFNDTKRDLRKTIKKTLLNPSVVAVYIGIIIFIFRIPVPDVIKQAAGHVGDMTMPLSMLIVGALISKSKFRALFNDLKVYYISALRTILMPLLAYVILYFTGIPQLPIAIIVTALAMPAAANTSVLADIYEKDAVFASKTVALSTLLSIITVPFITSLL